MLDKKGGEGREVFPFLFAAVACTVERAFGGVKYVYRGIKREDGNSQSGVRLSCGILERRKPVPDVPIGLQARPSADYHLIGNMNHLMKACDTMDQQKQMATYTDPALPLHKDVLILIEKFVSKP